MSVVIGFLTSKLGRVAMMGLLVVGLLVWGNIGYARLKHAKTDLTAARAALYVPLPGGKPSKLTWKAKAMAAETNLTTCSGNVDRLVGGLETQNRALEAAKAEGDRRAAALDKALQAARKEGMAAQSNAERILGIHAKGSDVCERMLDAEKQVTEQTR